MRLKNRLIVKANNFKYSFVIKDIADGRILAISINFDASVKLKEFDASVFKSSYFLEFLDRVQTPIM